MTKDDIIRMAWECDLGRVCGPLDTLLDFEWEYLRRFANLVAAAEREECAKVCEGINGSALWFAKQIRARSNHD